MQAEEIALLCIVVAAIAFVIGYGVGFLVWGEKCDHRFEEVLNTCGKGGSGNVVVHMCKKCGKRKITKV